VSVGPFGVGSVVVTLVPPPVSPLLQLVQSLFTRMPPCTACADAGGV
jgi:hypothetical protein